MNIRTATPQDFDAIYALVQTAFQTALVCDGNEQDFVLKLRSGGDYLPDLEFVAELGGELIGHVMLTRQRVQAQSGDFTGVLVAPLCVALAHRSQGIGGDLLRHAFQHALQAGYEAAFLVGNPDYYGRFGFRKTSDFGIQNATETPDQYVLACELQPDALCVGGGSISIVE